MLCWLSFIYHSFDNELMHYKQSEALLEDLVLYMTQVFAQLTFPVICGTSPKSGTFALTNATIAKDWKTTIADDTPVIR